ncbi:sensor histidine kinase [Rhizobium halophilum]|uniref:sensor histidine kinase n=1 Tax=Rhizobium halophilum TaxID=2846852 RepID=UPI001EFDF42A|nr:PAS domain S-box protein [Rhizobium halophilum]MCF6370920.1 PAS domain S-box protein [Rhizobium halophilum]
MTSSPGIRDANSASPNEAGGRNVVGATALAIAPYDPKDLLASIVESSQDAIISKTINGIITSWNRGAEQLFGYQAEEVVGKPITILIPEDRLDEEPAILAKLRAGQKVDHFDTVRRRKDGSLLDISLTISPIKDSDGTIVGASKIARDISSRKRDEERQRLLLGEMHHRVKNLFALTSGLITMASKSAVSPAELAHSMRQRLSALAAAHDLTLPSLDGPQERDEGATLQQLLEKVVAPYQDESRHRISLLGPDFPVAQSNTTKIALLFHELATNAAKYGALSIPDGRVAITIKADDDQIILAWKEIGGPLGSEGKSSPGFGTRLIDSIARGFPATVDREWGPDGLCVTFEIAVSTLQPERSIDPG